MEEKPPIDGQNLNETMKFSAYDVRNVVMFESYPLDPAEFRDIKERQPILSIIASALTGGAIGWAFTFIGKYFDPNTSPQRWEEIMLIIISIAACVFHTMAGTIGNKHKRNVLKKIEQHFDSKPRETVSISTTKGNAHD